MPLKLLFIANTSGAFGWLVSVLVKLGSSQIVTAVAALEEKTFLTIMVCHSFKTMDITDTRFFGIHTSMTPSWFATSTVWSESVLTTFAVRHGRNNTHDYAGGGRCNSRLNFNVCLRGFAVRHPMIKTKFLKVSAKKSQRRIPTNNVFD